MKARRRWYGVAFGKARGPGEWSGLSTSHPAGARTYTRKDVACYDLRHQRAPIIFELCKWYIRLYSMLLGRRIVLYNNYWYIERFTADTAFLVDIALTRGSQFFCRIVYVVEQ